MDWTPNIEDLKVLKHAFQCSDFDGDGFVSKQDLKVTSGLQADEDVNALFNALKESAGDISDHGFTFEQFCRGIIDFPFLLEHLKQDFISIDSEPDQGTTPGEDTWGRITYSRESTKFFSYEGLAGSELSQNNILFESLKKTVSLLDQTLKTSLENSSAPEPYHSTLDQNIFSDKENLEPLFEGLFFELKMIESKLKHAGKERIDYTGFMSKKYVDCMKLILIAFHSITQGVKEHVAYSDSYLNELKLKLEESMTNLEHLRESNEVLESSRKKLISRLNQLEMSTESTEFEQSKILAQNLALQQHLKKVEHEGLQARIEVNNVQSSIKDKEDTISNLSRELRRLTSLKTLQEMRQTSRISPTRFKERKQLENTIRCSVPSNYFLPLASPCHRPRETMAFKFPKEDAQEASGVFREQKERVMRMAEEVRKKARMLEEKDALIKKEMELLEEDYESQIAQLKEQNHELYRLLKQEKLKNNTLRMTITRDTRYSTGGTLFEELSRLEESGFDMSIDEIEDVDSFEESTEEAPSYLEKYDSIPKGSILEVDEEEEFTPRRAINRLSGSEHPNSTPAKPQIEIPKLKLPISKPEAVEHSPVTPLKVPIEIPRLKLPLSQPPEPLRDYEDKAIQVEILKPEQKPARKILAKYRVAEKKKSSSFKDRCCNWILP